MHKTFGLLCVAALGCALFGFACGGAPCPKPGAPVSGTPDDHCSGMAAQPTSMAACHPAGVDGGTDPGGDDYGPTMYNASGDDDDCKYHVTWSVTDVCENNDVTFTVTATNKTDGSPVTGADIQVEGLIEGMNHPLPNTAVKTTENGGGKYTVGPIRFDAAARWTVRFHLFEDCADLSDDSPHGHAAFYLDVP